MKEYKGYTIERITRRDWIIRDHTGEMIGAWDDRPSTETLKSAKEFIDYLEKKEIYKKILRGEA